MALLFVAFLFWLAVHGLPWVTWVLAIIFLVSWTLNRLARIRWRAWYVKGPYR